MLTYGQRSNNCWNHFEMDRLVHWMCEFNALLFQTYFTKNFSMYLIHYYPIAFILWHDSFLSLATIWRRESLCYVARTRWIILARQSSAQCSKEKRMNSRAYYDHCPFESQFHIRQNDINAKLIEREEAGMRCHIVLSEHRLLWGWGKKWNKMAFGDGMHSGPDGGDLGLSSR